MLGTLLKILSLEKEYPPIHFFHIPLLGYPIPKELSEKLDDEIFGLYVEIFGIDNLSNKVQRNIRIVVSSKLNYSPIVEGSKLGRNIKWVYDKERSEIFIGEIDPKDSVYVSLFPAEANVGSKNKPKIIINDMLLTKSSELHGFARKNPKFSFFMVLMITACVGLLYASYEAISKRPTSDDYGYINSRLSGFVACSPYVINQNDSEVSLEDEIRKSKWPVPAIAQINEVSDISDLKTLDKVILCK